MKERNVILRGVVPVVVALLIFVGLVLAAEEIDVNITPHHLSLTKGEARFVRCYVNATELAAELAELEEGESVIYTLGVGGDFVLSLQKLQHLDDDDDIQTIWFDVEDVRVMLAGKTGDVTLTLNIMLEDGTVLLSGSDTITVTD
jgi:hypothetical protein